VASPLAAPMRRTTPPTRPRQQRPTLPLKH
jgi:hypothetical protein